MAITKFKKAASKNEVEDLDAFIGGTSQETAAPAVPEKPRYVRKGKKLQITLTIAQPLLERVDQMAAQMGQSRAAIINLAIYQGLEKGLRIDKPHQG